MEERKNKKLIKFFKAFLRLIKPKFSFHYVSYLILFLVISFSTIQLIKSVGAVTPNPGHPWSELGDGVFVFSNGQTTTPYTYTFPAATTTVLTTNSLVSVAQGGTGLGSIASGSVLGANSANVLSAITSATGTKVLTNTGGTITWENQISGMVYPGAGIPVSTGSAWGTSITDNSSNWNSAYTYRLTSASGTSPLTLTLLNNSLTGSISQATTSASGYLSSTDWNTFNSKQVALVSGTNIKTINSTTLLGSGDISLQTPLTAGVDYLTPTAISNAYVPYTGATGAVALGANTLSTTSGIITPKIYPASDSTTAFQINKADGTTNVLNVDTTNSRVGIGTTSPSSMLHVNGTSLFEGGSVFNNYVAIDTDPTNNPSGFEYGNGYDPTVSNYDNEKFRVNSFFESPFVSMGVAQNYLLQTEVFDNGSWVKTDIGTVSANGVVAPNGATTAENIPVGSNSSANISQQITNSTTGYWTAGVWARTQSGTATIALRIDSSAETGTEKNINLTTKWQFFSVTQNFTTAHTTKTFRIISGANAVSLWGARMSQGQTAQTYSTRTTSALTTATAGAFFNGTTIYGTLSGSASSASSAGYSNYGILLGNTLSNTSNKTDQWAYFGNVGVTYNSTYRYGHSWNIEIILRELSNDNITVPVQDLEKATIVLKGNMPTVADANVFNSTVPDFSVEISGNTKLTKDDIAARVESTSTSSKVIRFYIKLKNPNTHYSIEPQNRYGASYSSSGTNTTSYVAFTGVATQAVVVSIPAPAQGSIVYATQVSGSNIWKSLNNDIYNLNSGNVGIGTNSPTNMLSLGGNSARTIWMERNTTTATAGQGLTLSSGGAIAGTADLAGGDLNLKSGISTGTGDSAIRFFTATASTSGTSDNTPNEKMTILGNGNVGIGTTSPGELLSLGLAGTKAGVLSLAGATSGKAIIQVSAVAGTPTLTLPTSTGTLALTSDIPLASPITIVNSTSLFSTGLSGTGGNSSATDSIFLGESTGYDAVNASNSIFLGKSSGSGATNALQSNFIGLGAGIDSAEASYSNFIGSEAGLTSVYGNYSNFIGYQAGKSATYASNSIFLGTNAGLSDTVDNVSHGSDYWSILIGYNTNTGGYNNSILLGGSDTTSPISNTKSNQFMLADMITDVRWRGVEYELPSSQGGSGYFLRNDGTGVLSWGAPTASVAWDVIGDPTGNGSIAMGSTVQTMDWATATTQNALSLTGASLTTGKLLSLTSNSLTSGTLLDITSAGTAGLTNQKGLNIALSGTNATSAQTTYGAYISNTHAGTTSTNVGLYASATGGTTANYAAQLNGDLSFTTGANRTISVLSGTTQSDLNLTVKAGSYDVDYGADGGHLYLKGGNSGTMDSPGNVYIDGGTKSGGNLGNIYLNKNGMMGSVYVGIDSLFQINNSGAIAAVTGYTQGSGTMSLTSANTTQTTTSSAFRGNFNSLTTGTGMYLASSSLTSGTLLDIVSAGTAGLTNQKGLNIALSGTNATSAQTTYGAYISNTHAGTTSTNVGLYVTASGGTTANYAAIFDSGNVGIGTTTPATALQIVGTATLPTVQGTTGSGGDLALRGNGANLTSGRVKVLTQTASTSSSTGAFTVAGGVGITGAVYLGGTTANTFAMERNTTAATAGQGLTLSSGGAIAGTANLAGGDLSLKSGISTGTGSSAIRFFTATAGTTGTTDNTPTEKMTILGSGNVGIGITAPTYDLHVVGATNDTYATYSSLTSNVSGSASIYSNYVNTATSGGFNRAAVYANALANPGADASVETFGVLGMSKTNADSYNHTSLYGLRFTAQHNGTGSVSNLFGSHVYPYSSSSGTVSSAYAYYTYPWMASGTFTNFYGFYMGNESLGTGTITNKYGVYILGSTYKNYFAGNLGLGAGATSPGTQLEIGSSDLGNGVAGPVITLGRNTNATNTGAGSINFLQKGGTAGYVWQDAAGNMRINTVAPSNANDTSGTVIGAQGSVRDTKQDIEDYTDYNNAFNMVVNAPLHTFRYIKEVNGYGTDSPLAKVRIGYIADEVDPVFMVGNSIDQVSVNGILMASIKEMNLKFTEINNFEKENTWRDNLIAWFANAENRITRIFTGEVCLTEAGEETVCLNRQELKSLKELLNQTNNNNNGGGNGGGNNSVVCNSPQILVNNVCVDPTGEDTTCSDGIKNQDETDIDIGGVCDTLEGGTNETEVKISPDPDVSGDPSSNETVEADVITPVETVTESTN